MTTQPTVHVVDDDTGVRDSLAFLLQCSGLTVAKYESAALLLDSAHDIRGCIVTDLRMPNIDGIALVRRLRERGARTPVIVMTGHGDVPLAVEAMKAGAADFIEKPFNAEVILASIEAALGKAAAETAHEKERTETLERIATLSSREKQVLDALVAGDTNKVIANDLGISPRTVEIYRAHVMTKMKAESLSALVRMALLAGKA
jgi:two-component system, LuxR family, response regulator FixJ